MRAPSVLLAFLLAAAATAVPATAVAAAAKKTPAPQPTPRPATTASELLSRVKRAYTSSPSTAVTFVQRYAPAGFADAGGAETGKVTLQPPNLLRFDYDGPEGKVYTFDGKSARQYVAQDAQMIVKTLTAEERARLPLLFLEDASTLLARFDATLVPGEGGVADVRLVPKGGGDPKEVVVTAGPDGDVKKLVVLDTGGNRTTFTFTQRAGGKRRPASDFILVPPKGTKTVTG